MATHIHPTAIIEAGAELGVEVVVGPFAVIGAGVEIGDRSLVDAGAQIQGPTKIGEDNRFFSYSCIGFDPQDLKFKGEETRLEIGDRNHFREHCTVHRGTGKVSGVLVSDIDQRTGGRGEGEESGGAVGPFRA